MDPLFPTAHVVVGVLFFLDRTRNKNPSPFLPPSHPRPRKLYDMRYYSIPLGGIQKRGGGRHESTLEFGHTAMGIEGGKSPYFFTIWLLPLPPNFGQVSYKQGQSEVKI